MQCFEIGGLNGSLLSRGACFRVAPTFKLLFSESAKVKSTLNIKLLFEMNLYRVYQKKGNRTLTCYKAFNI